MDPNGGQVRSRPSPLGGVTAKEVRSGAPMDQRWAARTVAADLPAE